MYLAFAWQDQFDEFKYRNKEYGWTITEELLYQFRDLLAYPVGWAI